MKKIYLVILLILVLAIGFFTQNKDQSKVDTISISKTQVEKNANEFIAPDTFLIEGLTFVPQAPYSQWDELHDEACEEASIIIVNSFNNNEILNEQVMENKIQAMVRWEIAKWGKHKNLTIAELSELSREYLNTDSKIVKINTAIDIEREISNGHPVIIPAAGRKLQNPNFRQPGPEYHMLVIVGYNKDQFITYDVGTKKGENYLYNKKVLFNAIHDWVESGSIEAGSKKALILLSK